MSSLPKPANGLRYAPVGYRWAGVDSAWEQEKLETSLSWPTGQGKMPEKAAPYQQRRRSGGVGVGRRFILQLSDNVINVRHP